MFSFNLYSKRLTEKNIITQVFIIE